ncbi:MAG: polysaccharide biosynthesis tyrosine autokinase [Chitinivibrionales bacterium]|nr:polysaccharide biosynthesis tyrosine autokinase [Chitinivibrionales bacterium]
MDDPIRKKFKLGDILRKVNEQTSPVIQDSPRQKSASPAPETGPQTGQGGAPAPELRPQMGVLPVQPQFGAAERPALQKEVPPAEASGPHLESPDGLDKIKNEVQRQFSNQALREKYTEFAAPAAPNEEEEFDIFRYLNILIRRRWVIVSVAAVFSMLALVSYLRREKYYVATAKMLFKPGRQDIIDEKAAYYDNLNRDELLQTNLEMLQSAEVLKRVQQNLNTESAGALSVTQNEVNGQKNDILMLECRHGDPNLARDMVNEWCKVYIAYNKEVYTQDINRLIFKFETQIDKVQAELTDKENVLRVFKEDNRMVELSSETNIVNSKLADMELALQKTRLDLLEGKERLTSLNSQIRLQDIDVVQSMTYQSPYESRLSELELQLQEQLAQNSPEHYKVIMIKQEIEKLKQAIRVDVQKATSKTFVKNPIRETLLQTLVSMTIDMAALDAKRVAQEQLIEKLNAEMLKMPSLEQRYAFLQRETESLVQALRMLKDRYEEAKIRRDSQESDLKILELASAASGPMSSTNFSKVFQWLLIGIIVGIVLTFLLEYIDQTIKEPSDVERALELPLLGIVPYIETENALIETESGKGKTLLEPFRALRANLKHLAEAQHAKVLIICSAVKGEGKTTLAANLAVSFAMDGKKVILIDADLRRSQLHNLFNVPKEKGLADYLTSSADLEAIIKPTAQPNLFVITSGERPPNPAELVGRRQFAQLTKEIRDHADIILFDSPALLPVSDAISMAPKMDGCLLVVRNFWTPTKAAIQARNQLLRIKCTIWGAILNGITRSRGYYPYYYGYYRYYHYKYSYEDEVDKGKFSLRETGLMLEKTAKEALRRFWSALPHYKAAAGVFLKYCRSKKTFWLLLGLIAVMIGLNAVYSVSRKGGDDIAIQYMGGPARAKTDINEKTAGTPLEAVHDGLETKTVFGGGSDSGFTGFADSIKLWYQSILKKDFSRFMDFYDTLDFKYPGGAFADFKNEMRSSFLHDPLFNTIVRCDSVWLESTASALIATGCRLSIISAADTGRADFAMLWRQKGNEYRIVGQKRTKVK